MNLDDAYRIATLLVGVGLSIKALETLALIPEYDKGGIFDYDIAGNDTLMLTRAAPVFARLYSRPGMTVLAVASVASFAVVALAPYQSPAYRVAVVAMVVANVAVYYRQAFGLDGADQMSFLVLVTIFFGSAITSDPDLQRVGAWFVALQLALSYLVSGVAKLISPEWRSGTAVIGILSTYTYGTRLTRRVLTTRRPLSRAICWAVIATEIALPFGLLFGEVGVVVALAVGLAMHLSIAVVMGLNDFVWGFAAAYPFFYWVGSQISIL